MSLFQGYDDKFRDMQELKDPEIIEVIEECEGFKNEEETWCQYDGFRIRTNQQLIHFGISNEQCCCENWGYFMTNDNPEEFVGAKLLSIDIVDECLVKEKAPDLYEGGAMFVNFETDKGTLQFTAYNDHNGYYGHGAIVLSKQLKHEETL